MSVSMIDVLGAGAVRAGLSDEILSDLIERTHLVFVFEAPSAQLAHANRLSMTLAGLGSGASLKQMDAVIERPEPQFDLAWRTVMSGRIAELALTMRPVGSEQLWVLPGYLIPGKNGEHAFFLVAETALADSDRNASRERAKVADHALGFVEISVEGLITSANANFLEWSGYQPDELLGQDFRILHESAATRTPAFRRFWNKLMRGEAESGEVRLLGRDGQDLWFNATHMPIFDGSGRVRKVIFAASDSTRVRNSASDFEGKITAIYRSQAVAEFDPNGNVLDANANFLALMGYALEEITGKHHRMFCDPAYTNSDAYRAFWEKLSHGEFDSGVYCRIGRDGREVWIQASYNPVFDQSGKLCKIVKFAADITASKTRNVEMEGRINAIERSQAVIEFDLEGHVLRANENFLRIMGYSAREVVGQHHSIFCAGDYIKTEEYRDFWIKLNRGEFHTGRFHRIGKFNRNVFIQASYGPILDLKGQPIKIVKYAYDITQQVELEQKLNDKMSEMMSVVTEMTGSIDEVTRVADVANGLANETQNSAEVGQEALQNAIISIDLIQKSSNEISEIVKVIGEIASQTNLLAFNAAIEAARAGENGVGFSVVSAEVRRLAERSSEAALNITKLIEESVLRVNQGSDRSQHAKLAFERIVASICKTTESIRDIANSTQSQQAVSQHVVRLIEDLTAASKA